MLFRAATLRAIARGEITAAYRRGTRRPAKPGGRQRTAAGELQIVDVAEVDPAAVTDDEARAAGFADAAALRAEPFLDRPGPLWRVTFTLADDPRVALRDEVPGDDGLSEILDTLAAKARRAAFDPLARLRTIRDNPGRRAPDLAAAEGLQTQVFKRQVRQLKELGLTESLDVGYRLSARGRAVLSRAEDRE
ncbi:hypothetical protein HKCCE2091_18770 [Rhodobacterales bacterium HKCCE2091]|nr:hypothetical protein [Rhodobacterales bacterium HKCCE2091]